MTDPEWSSGVHFTGLDDPRVVAGKEALEACGGNLTHAAEMCGVSRHAIRRVKRYLEKQGGATYGGAPEGYVVKGTSTLYGSDGSQVAQWVKTSRDQARQEEMFRETVAELTRDLPRYPKRETKPEGNAEILSFYPVGDHHVGMLAWAEETGDEDYDLKLAETLLVSAANYLMDASPASAQCVIAFMGDFMHYDSFEAETPTNKNRLDPDSRYPKMVRTTIRLMRYMVERALDKHEAVHVIVEIGNHDLSSSIFLMECLENVYESEPRVTVDTSPQHFHYYRFGKVLLATHHGHGVKMTDLPLLMATDRATDWGETEYRHWWMGHIHHRSKHGVLEFNGCDVESLRVLGPKDAHHAQKGYRSLREMLAVVYHRDFGETSRLSVKPEMLKET